MKFWSDLTWLEKIDIEAGDVNHYSYLSSYSFDVKSRVEAGQKAKEKVMSKKKDKNYMLPLTKVESWSAASKIIGWDKKIIGSYPTIQDVEGAIINNDLLNLLNWHRYLRSPVNREEEKIINKIVEYIRKYK